MMRLSRARFALGFPLAALATRAVSAAEFSFKLGNPDPVDFPTNVRMVQMAKAVENETRGRLRIDVFPNSQLGSPNSMLSQLRIGSLQLLFVNHAAYSTVVPATQIDGIGYVFPSQDVALDALDGQLGAYIRNEFAAKAIYAFEKSAATGYRQMVSATRPIRRADDLVGFKVRTIPSPAFVDLFRALGASPVPLDSNEMYTATQTHIVDGVELPLSGIEGYRMYEVTKYISMTNHIWGGYWLTMNMDAWKSLPGDLQTVLQRNAAKYILLERSDLTIGNASVADKLRRQGITFNDADVSTMKARLGTYYARWKNEFGPTVWGLLEAKVGKLG
jgi:tripartite ATP-independent transporter DctP family solute receptor